MSFIDIEDARIAADLSIADLWMAYFSLGGFASLAAVRDHLNDTVMPARDHDLLVDALNDCFIGQGGNHPVRYSGKPKDQNVDRVGA
jgi:hypothetical protein